MEHLHASILLFISLSQWLVTDLTMTRPMSGNSLNLVFLPTILSAALDLLVKCLIAGRILPLCKLVSGSLLVLLVSWYLDRICKNNAFLLVRAVGLAILFCLALGGVIVSEEGFAGSLPRIEAQAAPEGANALAGD